MGEGGLTSEGTKTGVGEGGFQISEGQNREGENKARHSTERSLD